MRRRTVLAALAAGSVAGCGALEPDIRTLQSDELGTCLVREQPQTHAPDLETDDPVRLGLENATADPRTATVRVTRGQRTVVDDAFTVEPDDIAAVIGREDDFTTTGDYDLLIDVADGPTVETTWRVCQGSFIVVAVLQDDGTLIFEKPGRGA